MAGFDSMQTSILSLKVVKEQQIAMLDKDEVKMVAIVESTTLNDLLLLRPK